MPTLDESLAKQEIPAAAPPPPPSPTLPAAPPAAAPPPPPEVLTEEMKAEKVVGFADFISTKLIRLQTMSLGVQWNEKLQAYAQLSPIEREELSLFAPAAYPYVEMVDQKLAEYPKIAAGIFAVILGMVVMGKVKTIKAQVAQAKGEPPADPKPPPPSIIPQPRPAAPAVEKKELDAVPPRKDKDPAFQKI